MRTHLLSFLLLLLLASQATAQSSNKKAQKLFEKGQKAMSKYLYIQATVDFTNAIAFDPDFAEAYFQRGLSFLAIERFDAGIKDLKRTIEKDPSKIMAYLELMNQYRNKSDYDQALAALDQLGEAMPAYVGVMHYQKGACYEAMKEKDKAIAAYKKAIETLDPKVDARMEELVKLAKEGITYLEKN